jgi:hypothetical protein
MATSPSATLPCSLHHRRGTHGPRSPLLRT